jgi:hypothetical protein
MGNTGLNLNVKKKRVESNDSALLSLNKSLVLTIQDEVILRAGQQGLKFF